ncbi:hypothetical protein B0H21DRAFT_824192 [Amylocystis lapponica]|nr:hypothetical protein B0H21DRAFT_824192 [Amylocystis lapponica]
MGMHVNIGMLDSVQQRPPSRPATASGQQQIAQSMNGAGYGMQGMQNQQQQPSMKSPGYAPIAPAPTHPSSPHRGAKRKLGGTPVPSQQQVQAQPPQTQRARSDSGSMSLPGGLPPNALNGTGLTGMGITGNVGPRENVAGQLGPGMGLGTGMILGGAGGGMMGPPVLPRSTSQHGNDGGGMSIGVNGHVPAQHARQSSIGAHTNANLDLWARPPRQRPLLIWASLHQMQARGSCGGCRAMASLTGMNFGIPGLGGMGTSQPPATSPVSAGLLGAQPAPVLAHHAAQGQPGVLERKMSVTGGLPGTPSTSRGTLSVLGADSAASGSNTHAPPRLRPRRSRMYPCSSWRCRIPPLSDDELADMQKWMAADKDYEATYRRMRDRMTEEMRATIGTHAWWERFRGSSRDAAPATREVYLDGAEEGAGWPRRLSPDDANRPEQLVPIRLEFDVDHNKMRDTPDHTPEIFAQSIVDDYSLAPSYHSVITKAIQDQLSDYKAHSSTFGEDGVMSVPEDFEVVEKGLLDDEDVAWWEAWRKPNPSRRQPQRKRRKVVKEEVVERTELPVTPARTTEQPMAVDEIDDEDSLVFEDMRILVKLDIIVGSVKLEDQFEWDLENAGPSPEMFAEIYAKELGLGGEFKTAIAHSIREQVQIYQKSLFLVGHPSDGSVVQDDDLRMSLLPSLSTAARSMDQVAVFTPLLNYLSESEMERNEKEREKELNRRRRKTTRGRRGIALPDRDPPKTYRTPAIGFPEIDPSMLAMVNAPSCLRPGAPLPPPPRPTFSAHAAGCQGEETQGAVQSAFLSAIGAASRADVKAPTPSTAADISSLPPPIESDIPPPSNEAPAETRGAKVVLTAKRVKELEREAKEKEYADGQHANLINGVWHCSNCGCPEDIAIGRRKGPLGDKSQCGTCGKFWHRHRRPRPVVYNSDAQFHMDQRKEAEQSKVSAKRKRPQAAVAEGSTSKAATGDGDADAEIGRAKSEVWVEVPPPPPPSAQPEDADRAVSPVSTASSASESPLAQRVLKMNGTGHAKSAPPGAGSQDPDSEPLAESASPPRASPPPSRPSAPPNAQHPSAPEWLNNAMQSMRSKYPHDRFEVISKKVPTAPPPEWRIKCHDCPGKLYTPGPGETLSNYEVHLKNRQHRQRTSELIVGDPKGAAYILTSSNYVRPESDRRALINFFGPSLFSAEGEEHKRQRAVLNNAFTSIAVSEVSHVIMDLAHELKTEWEDDLDRDDTGSGVLYEITEKIHRMALNAICMTALAHSLREDPKIQEILTEWQRPAQYHHTVDDNAAYGARSHRKRGMVRERTAPAGMHTKLIDSMKNAESVMGKPMEHDLAVGQIVGVLFAGYETTSNVTAECLYELARHPDIQTKLREELVGFAERTGHAPTFDDLMGGAQLEYLDAVTRETLRTKAPLVTIARAAVADDAIPLQYPVHGTGATHVAVEPGQLVNIPVRDGINVDPTIWGPDAAGMGHMLTFGDGPKICLGRQFALAEMKIMLATFVAAFDFRPDDVKYDFYHGSGNTIKPHPRVGEERGKPSIRLRMQRIVA